jgi:hypothetical protein
LGIEFRRSFSEKSLRHALRFVDAFHDFEIVSVSLDNLPEFNLQTRRQPNGRRGKQ